MGRGEVAIGIARAAIENARSATATGAAAADKFSFVALGAFDAERDRPRVLAFWIPSAANEFAVAAVFFDQALAARRAFFIQRLVWLERNARALYQAACGFAIGIAGAGEEGAKAAALDGHFLAAIVAIFGGTFGIALGDFGRKILDEVALGITRAAEEKSVAADAFEQFALAALFAGFACRDARFVREHLLVGPVEVHDKFFPEFLDGFAPVKLSFLDFVKLFFEARSEGNVEDVLETFHEQTADALAKHGGREATLLFLDVLALDDGGDDRGVRGRAANAFFFQVLDQRRFGVARRRLGEMLLRTNLTELQRLAFFDSRKRVALAFVALFVVLAVGVGGRQLVNA